MSLRLRRERQDDVVALHPTRQRERKSARNFAAGIPSPRSSWSGACSMAA
jgi:hypothetical protein